MFEKYEDVYVGSASAQFDITGMSIGTNFTTSLKNGELMIKGISAITGTNNNGISNPSLSIGQTNLVNVNATKTLTL